MLILLKIILYNDENHDDYFKKFENRWCMNFEMDFGRANIQDITDKLIFMTVRIISRAR